MLLRIALFALMAVGLVGFGAVAWFSTMPAPEPAKVEVAPAPEPSPPPPPPPPAKAMTIVAARPLRAGTFLTADDIRADDMLVSQIPPDATPDTPATRALLLGAMVRHTLGEGQPLLPQDILRPGDHGFLAAVLEPGMRAVVIRLTDVATDWGLIWPGDRVDLILSESFDANDILPSRHFAAETVLSDLRVVAVDQQLAQGQAPEDKDHKDTRNLTVEVSPVQAQRLIVALRMGKVAIALRSAVPAAGGGTGDKQVLSLLGAKRPSDRRVPTQRTIVTWSGDVAQALSVPTRPVSPVSIPVFHGQAGS